MNALVKADESANEVVDLSGGLLAVIARAARDPAVDIDKMERLLLMQERVQTRDAEIAFNEAFSEMQPKLPIITKSGQIIHKGVVISEFAEWENINEAITPVLAEHGFSLSFKPAEAKQHEIAVTAILRHRSGHKDEATLPLPIDSSGAKNAVQGVGSTLSYAKRYSATLLLNITTKGDDDDGESATYMLASGQPKPRAVLNGPHTSKTALKNAVHDLIGNVRKAQSLDALKGLIRDNKETIDQAKTDWPALIYGDDRIQEDTGLDGAYAERQAELDEDGTLSRAIQDMRESCGNTRQLEDWVIANAPFIETLDGAESRRFEAAHAQFEAGLAVEGAVRAG